MSYCRGQGETLSDGSSVYGHFSRLKTQMSTNLVRGNLYCEGTYATRYAVVCFYVTYNTHGFWRQNVFCNLRRKCQPSICQYP